MTATIVVETPCFTPETCKKISRIRLIAKARMHVAEMAVAMGVPVHEIPSGAALAALDEQTITVRRLEAERDQLFGQLQDARAEILRRIQSDHQYDAPLTPGVCVSYPEPAELRESMEHTPGVGKLEDAATIVRLTAEMAAERPDAPAGDLSEPLVAAVEMILGGLAVLHQTQKDFRFQRNAEIAAEKACNAARFAVIDVTEIVAVSEADQVITL